MGNDDSQLTPSNLQLLVPLNSAAAAGGAGKQKRNLIVISGHQRKIGPKPKAKTAKKSFRAKGSQSQMEKTAWNLSMQLARAKKRIIKNELDALNLLSSVQKNQQGQEQ